MCRPTACRRCGGTTWAGCGQHVDQVMSRVPKDQHCTCTTEDRASSSGGGFLSRLLGR